GFSNKFSRGSQRSRGLPARRARFMSEMPELPDVEVFKRYLDSTALHQTIRKVEVLSARILKGVSARELARKLERRQFASSRRHGKHIFVRAGDSWLRLHFGMTGFVRYFNDEENEPPH